MTETNRDLLAAALARRRTQLAEPPRHVDELAPLAPMQFGLWYAHALDPEDPSHHRTTVFEIEGSINIERLRAAINRVVARHEPLRTIYPRHNGEPIQVVLPHHECELEIIDCACEQFAATCEATIAAADRRTFSIELAPSIHATLVTSNRPQTALLIFALSHLGFDGTSEIRLLAELQIAYHNGVLEPLATNYRDWAAPRSAEALTAASTAAAHRWGTAFRSAKPPLQLPVDWLSHDQCEDAHVTLEAETAAALKAFALARRVTQFSVVLTALAALVSERAQASNVDITVPIDIRSSAATESLIGCLIETAAIRIAHIVDESRGNAAQRIHRQLLELHDDRIGTFAEAVSYLSAHTQRPISIDPTISAQWRRIHTPNKPSHDDELRIIVRPRAPLGDGFNLRVDETHKGIDIRLGSRAIGGSWLRANEVSAELVSALERIVHANGPLPTANAEPDWVATQLREHRQKDPHAVLAVTDTQETISRQAFAQRVAATARALQRLAVQPGDTVAITANGIDGAIAIHAAWSIGAISVPIDPNSPPKYRDRIVAMIAPTVIVEDLQSLLTDRPATAEYAERSQDVAKPSNTVNSPGLILFTSGSTGEPSGVILSRGAITAYAISARERYAITDADRLLPTHSLAFDAALLEYIVAPCAGATIVYPPNGLTESIQRTLDFITTQSISMVDFTASYWHELVRHIAIAGTPEPPSLRITIIGGQAARIDRVRQWREQWPTINLINAYGPTEATVEVTTANLRTCTLDEDVPIGTPISNAEIALVDHNGTLITGSGTGELWVAGPQLALGYLGDPDRTLQRFVVGHGELAHRRWYRTGDLVGRDQLGCLWFQGRIDNQLKVRGFRIEPEAVERVIASHAAVREAIVVAHRDQLIAHVITNAPDIPFDQDAVIRHVGERLPQQSIPSRFVVHSSFARSPSGKVDRRRLDEQRAPTSAASTEVAIDPQHRNILELWRTALNTPDLGVTDNFFRYGGTSLQAIRLLSEIERSLERPIALTMLIHAPTVESFCQALFAEHATAPDSCAHVVRLGQNNGPHRLFVIPPGGGEIIALQRLANCWPRISTTTFALPGMNGSETPLRRVSEIATFLAEHIVGEQANGPYFIAGYSLGGFAAVEVARVLARKGHAVGSVIMIDPNRKIRFRGFMRWLRGDRQVSFAVLAREGLHRQREIVRVARTAQRQTAGNQRGTQESIDVVWHYVVRAFRRWEPQPVSVPVHVLRATGTGDRRIVIASPDPVLQFASHATITAIPGMHSGESGIFAEPHITALASTIQAILEAAS